MSRASAAAVADGNLHLRPPSSTHPVLLRPDSTFISNHRPRPISSSSVRLRPDFPDDHKVQLFLFRPPSSSGRRRCGRPENQQEGKGFFCRSSSMTSRIRRKFPWLLSASGRSSVSRAEEPAAALSFAARNARKMQAQLDRTQSRAQWALTGLRFISKTTSESEESSELWKRIDDRCDSLAKDGFLSRDDFAECIGMVESKEFGAGLFHALARRRRQKIDKINKDEFYDFWLEISDQSFDARLQIFFDMADSNADGRITREEVQELIMLSASANKLSKLKEQAEEYASLIMEELDPENLGYIELWQLEALLLQRDDYMNYSRPLSTTSAGRSQGVNGPKTRSTLVRTIGSLVRWRLMENNWERTWVVLVWVMAMAGLFTWKFFQYRNKSAFQVMGYCLPTAKGAAETLKLNMALVLLPVCRNTLTWLRSTRARLFVPFNDNVNFHKNEPYLQVAHMEAESFTNSRPDPKNDCQ